MNYHKIKKQDDNFIMTQENPNSGRRLTYSSKVWIFAGIVALVFILLWILKFTIQILLLIMASSLMAIFFHRLAKLIRIYLKFPKTLSLITSVLLTFLIIVLFFWFVGAKVQQQLADLSETLPATIDNARNQISKSSLGQKILEYNRANFSSQKTYSYAQRFFSTGFGILGDLYVMLFIGIFFTISPVLYVDGFISLIPKKGQPKARDVINKIGDTLGAWMKGQIIAMFVVAILTFIGLSIINIPMALALSLIAGVLNFIPNFGPLIAMIPAMLIGLLDSPTTALIIGGIYLLIQGLESNLITPYIQNRLIKIPPALILMGQVLMGALLGVLGILLAMPIVALIIVVVKELYTKKQQ